MSRGVQLHYIPTFLYSRRFIFRSNFPGMRLPWIEFPWNETFHVVVSSNCLLLKIWNSPQFLAQPRNGLCVKPNLVPRTSPLASGLGWSNEFEKPEGCSRHTLRPRVFWKYGGFFLHNRGVPHCFAKRSREVRKIQIKSSAGN